MKSLSIDRPTKFEKVKSYLTNKIREELKEDLDCVSDSDEEEDSQSSDEED